VVGGAAVVVVVGGALVVVDVLVVAAGAVVEGSAWLPWVPSGSRRANTALGGGASLDAVEPASGGVVGAVAIGTGTSSPVVGTTVVVVASPTWLGARMTLWSPRPARHIPGRWAP